MYRKCSGNSTDNLFPELEAYLKAYYNLMDDCKDFPFWHRKLEEDLGGSMSMLAAMIEEVARDDAVKLSPVFARYDAEK